MKLPDFANGLLPYGELARELHGRLLRCGLADCSDEEKRVRVRQLYWLRIWTVALALLSLVVIGWVFWRCA